jgi:ATP-dependent protease HslVU (ClpYQ) peptidase subunit
VTCIVGFVEGGTVWMGGDSAGVGGYDLTVRADKKVFKNGEMLFGFTTSFRMGQLLRYAFTPPDHDPRVDVEKYMSLYFIDSVRECLKKHGWAEKHNEQERGGLFLVGYKSQLFRVDQDYQVGVPVDPYSAVGCGEQIAHGAMFAAKDLRGRERIEVALQAAERFSAGVRGPFHIESLS